MTGRFPLHGSSISKAFRIGCHQLVQSSSLTTNPTTQHES